MGKQLPESLVTVHDSGSYAGKFSTYETAEFFVNMQDAGNDAATGRD